MQKIFICGNSLVLRLPFKILRSIYTNHNKYQKIQIKIKELKNNQVHPLINEGIKRILILKIVLTTQNNQEF